MTAFPAIDLEADLPPIRTDIPITLHPSALLGTKELNVEGTLGASALGTARTALLACHEAYAKIEDVQKELTAQAKPVTRHQNVTNKPNTPVRYGSDYSDHENIRMVNGVPQTITNHEEFLAAATKAIQQVSPKVDAKVRELKGVHTILSGKVASAIDDPQRKTAEGIATAQEVRNYVRGLSEKGRFNFLTNSVEVGDKSTVAAVLHAQPFLSGLSIEQHAIIREQAAMKFAPQEHTQAQATAKLIDQVTSAGSTLIGRYAKVTALKESAAAIINRKIKALAEGK